MPTCCSPDFQLERDLAMRLCETFDSPTTRTVLDLLQKEDYRALKGMKAPLDDSTSRDNFAADYLVVELLKKSPNLPVDVDRRQAAWDSFWTSLVSCAATNDKLMRTPVGSLPDWFCVVQELLMDILPPLDSRTENIPGFPAGYGERLIDVVQTLMKHGPGATTGVSGDGTVPSIKYDAAMHHTVKLIPFFDSLLGPVWKNHMGSRRKLVAGSVFSTAPKNAFTDRPIAKEPTLNVYGQLGIGKTMAMLMKRLGVDITKADRNRSLASTAQQTQLCTIDLKSASDLISYMVVLLLFPYDWFHLMDLFRSQVISVPRGFPMAGEDLTVEMFSSMGNGFTFAMQSALFLALARSVVPRSEWKDVSVFGDDIIMPRTYAPDLIDRLHYLGMQVNMEKTFLAGRFFESCGTDWLDGQNVRPFYCREASYVSDDEDVHSPYPVQLANQLRLWAWRSMDLVGCDMRVKPIWDWLVSLCPREYRRCLTPPSMGNAGITTSFSESQPRRACRWLEPPSPALRGRTKRVANDLNKELTALSRPTFVEGYLVRHIKTTAVYQDRRTFGVVLRGLAELDYPNSVSSDAVSSKGREPRRGYLGRLVPGWAITLWPETLDWI